ncbi:MAG: diphthine synthase [Methanomicrobiales archaeon]|nr:diphthine synthase [Methanomicrobiales archaeon]MDI6877396.1 diphthine synthase [Methanomicrobiales archaeon]
MLTFVGLGLYDERDISCKGLECVRKADHVYLECYTSRLTGTTVDRLQAFFGKPLQLLERNAIEQDPAELLDRARNGRVVLLTGGDPMVSTTHIDLRLRAAAAGIPTHIIHGASISTAVCGITGLQNYRFGKSCSIPYPRKGWFPLTPWETVRINLELNLHTLVFLDIQPDRCMTIPEGIELLERMAHTAGEELPSLYVGVARAGSRNPRVAAGSGEALKRIDFGPPLHVLAVPAELHPMEREYLDTFARL